MRISRRWRFRPSLSGDWQAKLVVGAQVLVVCAAVITILAMVTRHPLLLLGFTLAQVLLLLGVVLFAVVALFAQRALVLERYGAGETIFREGDRARHVYVIKAGAVEVLMRRAGGAAPVVVKRLGPGDHFGEMALLRRAPRTATIRTVTAVEVFRMTPGNFQTLYSTIPGLREHFNQVMATRVQELEQEARREASGDGAAASRAAT